MRGCGPEKLGLELNPTEQMPREGARSVSEGDRVGGLGCPPAAGARPPPRVSPALSPRAAGAESGRGRGPAAGHTLPTELREGTEHAELFLTCSVTGVSAPWGLEPAGRPESCRDSAVANPPAPGPRGRTRAPAREEARAAPVGLPSRSVPTGPPVPPRARGG